LCPTRALDFADVPEEDLVTDIDGFPITGLGPRIRIAPLKPSRRLPVVSAPAVDASHALGQPQSSERISLRSEWSLMLFTTLAATLVAWLTSAVVGAVSVPLLPFIGGAALTLGLASLHLGRPWRAYRAALNVRRSWLTREVVSLSAFFAAGVVYAGFGADSVIIGALAAFLGFLALYCADQVYSVLERAGPGYLHSASVLWTGFFLTSVLVGSAWLAAAFGFGKLTLYVFRKLRFIEGHRPVRPGVTATRLALGFVLPLALWLLQPADWRYFVLGAVLIGEVVDRAEYYTELESTSPGLLMREALERKIAAYARRPRRQAVRAAAD
jgi:DMSO reductase anchor subunit